MTIKDAIYALEYMKKTSVNSYHTDALDMAIKALEEQTKTCEGCKHLGKWENEVEYGCSSPCTRCKRRVEDYYER